MSAMAGCATDAMRQGGGLYSAAMSVAPADPDSDETLMLAFAAGDMAAFDALYARHRRGLYAFLARLLPAQDAQLDDLFQDVWLRVARARETYAPQAQFRTWLFQIARNRTIDWVREKHPVLASELVCEGAGEADEDPFERLPDERTPGPEAAYARQQEGARLSAALATLPAEQREAFLLREHGELSLEEIAQTTGVNTETAKSRLRYAVKKLRAALGGRRE
ncbi:RNA polymerase sigma factor [Niveibacterium sp. SC-1]|uniref:RNA polymerase sigma factor n=1 Tax=Niveibacterium sp. SC-1 TaxID=3135646 RepID=UPI00311FB7C0